ncbi:replication initiation protein [Corynebacterium breve]|uniref:Replication initiation protein n=1 Tax=Corynebacterium breve TaxID=3049799 RepID=A0ABY8VFJ8_9CORY|nr:replication initiation protein [Corynebacterium breve]WIM67540.1 replication initiation protein [Corynebacterium breve]
MIWLIDPVYADESGHSPHMKLLAATTRALGELLDHDPHFAHRFRRSPFYDGDNPHAYRWYCQHHRDIRLGDVIDQVRELAGQPGYRPTPRQQFTSGREFINAVKTYREEAQALKAFAGGVEAEISGKLEVYDSELIQGVRIYWIGQG